MGKFIESRSEAHKVCLDMWNWIKDRITAEENLADNHDTLDAKHDIVQMKRDYLIAHNYNADDIAFYCPLCHYYNTACWNQETDDWTEEDQCCPLLRNCKTMGYNDKMDKEQVELFIKVLLKRL